MFNQRKALIILKSISLIGIFFVSNAAFSAEINTFYQAKKALYSKVYPGKGKTIYTGCDWHIQTGKKIISLKSCGLSGQLSGHRSKQLEAEHVIPSSWGYKKNNIWRACVGEAKNKGQNIRKYCRKNDSEFRTFHNDLIGLYPSVGRINMKRSNKPFSESESGYKSETYMGRSREITITNRIVVPPKKMRGDIARIGLFYEIKYGIKPNNRQKALYLKWAQEDPVSQEEVNRNNKIKAIQGWGNPLVSK